MKKCSFVRNVSIATASAAALIFSSCTYDPAYSSSSSGGNSYGQGYGYGGSSFNTSLFVRTGNPRWGYDPSCYSYYDYSSRRYYDPYLSGYYPIGYRPQAVYGVPHPYGWNSSRGYCPPPRRVSNVTVVNYRDRESSYRNSDYSWARGVRGQAQAQSRPNSYRQEQPNYGNSTPRGWGRTGQEMESRPNRFGNQSSFGGSSESFGNRGITSERSQRTSEASEEPSSRSERPQLGNPGEERSSGRGQSFERPERSPQRQESTEVQQAQPEARREAPAQIEQIQERMEQPRVESQPEPREVPNQSGGEL